jgi:hypothetical protein
MSSSINKTKNGRLVYESKIRFGRLSANDDYGVYERKSAFLEKDMPVEGKTYMVATREYVGPNRNIENYIALFWAEDNGTGWGGNSDPSICRYHGWRGTTDDWSFYGYGVRKCLSVKITGTDTRRLRIVWGRDLMKDYE